EAAHARVSVRRETRALLVAGVDDLHERAALELVVETQHVIARDAEDVFHAVLMQPLDEILADGDRLFHALCRTLTRRERRVKERSRPVLADTNVSSQIT